MLNEEFPVIENKYQMTDDWSLVLPGQFNCRFEDDCLVIWKPDFTMWIAVWGNDKKDPIETRIKWIKESISPKAFNHEDVTQGEIVRFAYQMKEASREDAPPTFYCYAVGKTGHVQMAVYYDDAKDIETARKIWRSLKEEKELS